MTWVGRRWTDAANGCEDVPPLTPGRAVTIATVPVVLVRNIYLLSLTSWTMLHDGVPRASLRAFCGSRGEDGRMGRSVKR